MSDMERAAVVFEQERTLPAGADLLVAINRASGVRCYRPAVLAAAQRALQLAASPRGPSFRDATVAMREQSRLVGGHSPDVRSTARYYSRGSKPTSP
ncbi:hypothetical protein D3C71_1677070 [compost metagenome]